MKDWSGIHHFRRREWKQDPDKIDMRLVAAMDRLREIIKKPIIIHEAWAASGYGENSQHYLGKAVDFHVRGGRGGYFVKTLFAIFRIPVFMGVGWYPGWSHPGFPVDIRRAKTPVLWIRENGVYRYGSAVMEKAIRATVFPSNYLLTTSG